MSKYVSKAFEFDFEDFKRWVLDIGKIYLCVIILFQEQIKNWTLDWRILWLTTLLTTLDFVKWYLTNYQK